MRDDDKAFADIVQQEFDEHWQPTPPPSDPPPPAAPDFHLNLFDDDESYRKVARSGTPVSPMTVAAVGSIGLGLVITVLKMLAPTAPSWLGWFAVACFVTGTVLALIHLVHWSSDRHDDGDDDPVV
ncbi:MAG: hypothetical protein LBV06_05705 [Propionibacteriaceae bacterium]|jgi:hypothetical protein|nr:hypothetical protein [Propionibacteriaceae bacterium]